MRLNMKDYTKGEAIRIIREWTNLTQKDFAKRIGKSKRTIEQYEAGTVNYGVEVLKTIAKGIIGGYFGIIIHDSKLEELTPYVDDISVG